MFDEGEKELTIFIPSRAGKRPGKESGGAVVRGCRAFPGVVSGEEEQREREGQGGAEEQEGAYPAVLHAAANSRGDCNVRHFIDFDGTRGSDKKQSLPLNGRLKSFRGYRLIVAGYFQCFRESRSIL